MDRRNPKSFCLPIVVVCVCQAFLFHAGAAQIEPSYVEVRLDGPRPSGTFTLANTGDVEERYRINALHFEITKSGALSTMESGDRSLAPWVRFNPREVTLPARTSRKVRFIVLPRGELKPGEYWGAMELENLLTQTATKGDPNTETAVTIQVSSSLIVPIFGTVGTVDYKGELTAARVISRQGIPSLEILFQSLSSGRLGILSDYRIENDLGEILAEAVCAHGYVLPGRQRIFSREIKQDIPPGTYTLFIDANAAHLPEPLHLTQKIQWPPPELVVAKPKVTVPTVSDVNEAGNTIQKDPVTNSPPTEANQVSKGPSQS